MKKIILVLLFAVFLIGIASAFEFDNVKSYDSISRTVTITNAFGLGEDIAEIQLITPSSNFIEAGMDRQIAEIRINNLDTYSNIFNKLEFYNKHLDQETNQDYVYKYKYKTGTEQQNIYKLICADPEVKSNCRNEVIGSKTVDVYEWAYLDPQTELQKGEYYIGIFTNTRSGDWIEWIPTLFGVRISEWTDFTSYTLGENATITVFGDSVDSSAEYRAMCFNAGASSTNESGIYHGAGAVVSLDAGATTDIINLSLWSANSSFAPQSQLVINSSVNVSVGLAGDEEINITLPDANRVKGSNYCIIFSGTTSASGYNIGQSGATNPYIYGLEYSSTDAGISWVSHGGGAGEYDLYFKMYYTPSTAPSVTVNSPSDNLNISTGNSLTINCSAEVVGGTNIENITLFIDGVENYTEAFGAGSPVEIETEVFGLSSGTHTWNCSTTDDNNEIGQSALRTIEVRNVTELAEYYVTSSVEGVSNLFQLNISISKDATITYKNLSYNNSLVDGIVTYIAGNNYTVYANATASNVADVSSIPFNWIIELDAGTIYNSTYHNQTVSPITPLNVSKTCPSGLSPAMCFNFQNEDNLTSLNASIVYNLDFGITDTYLEDIYGSLSNIDDFCLCINSTLTNNYKLDYGEIQYSASGFVDRRFYTFSSQRLSNATVNNTLYLIYDDDATSFLFEFSDTNLNPYISKYATLLRWYPNLNEYKTVDMGKTDDKGQTVMRVVVEDVDYRVGLYNQNGTLIDLLNPVRFACLDSPCSYSSIIGLGENDYTSHTSIEGSLSYNEATGVFTFIWSDPTQTTQNMNLTIYKISGTSNYAICSDTSSGYTGVLTCNVSAFSGTLRGLAFRTASPQTPLFDKVIQTASTVFKGFTGLLIALVIFVSFALIGIISPVLVIIFGVIALIPAVILGSLNISIVIGIAVLGGLIVHFMKRI